MVVVDESVKRTRLEEAFSIAEANVALEGFDPHRHPLFRALKERVLAGEMTPSEMTDEVIAYATKQKAAAAAA